MNCNLTMSSRPLSGMMGIVVAGMLVVSGCESPSVARSQSDTASNAVHASATAEGAGGEPGSMTQPTTAPALDPTAQALSTGESAEAYRLVSRNDEIVSVLKDGATIIVKRIASPVTTVRAYIRAGSLYEGPWEGGGLSHLLEHLVAGGSNKRRTEAQNRDLLQKIGNNSNAFTYFDQTAFFVNTTAEYLDPAVDLVTGWVLGAKITEPEFEREREVVQRELEKDKGDPEFVFAELAERNRYHVSPAGVPVIGYQPVIQRLVRNDVYTYYKEAYQTNNMIFSIAGDIEPAVMLATLQKYLADARPGRIFSHDIADEPAVLTPRTLAATFPKLGQARLQLGFPGVRLDSPDVYALDLLATALGGGESSLLAQEIRRQKQLVQAIAASDDTPHYVTGTFAIQMQLDPDKIAPATQAVLALIEQVKQKGIDADRLQHAKVQMKAARIRQLLTSEGVGESSAEDMLSAGDPHFSDVYLDRIEKVTPEQVQAVAKKYLNASKLLTTALIPGEYVGAAGLPKAVDLLRPIAPATQPVPPQPASPVVRTELPDGTILLVKRISTSPLISIQLYGLGGVTAEDAKTNGLGNLAMHALSRGTKTRSADQIAEFFDSTGGEFAATSGSNSWLWTASCLKDQFAKTMQVYADVIEHPAFDEKDIDATRRDVLGEIAEQDAEWTGEAFRFFKKAYYGPLQSPYQFSPTGTAPNVTGFTADQVRDWYEHTILPSKKVLAVYGDVNPSDAEKIVRQYFGNGPKSDKVPQARAKLAPAQPAAPGKPDCIVLRVEVNKTQQPLAGVVIGYDSNSVVGSPATFPLTVADTLTSGYTYPTGYLFETLRGQGLVYEADAQNSPGCSKDLPGTFVAFAGCDPKKVDRVVDLMLENIARVQGTNADINTDWFKRAKELIAVADAMEAETPTAQAQQAALDELFGLGYDWHKQFAGKIRAVDLPEVRQTARQRLRECVVTVSTPNPEWVHIKTGRREYSSFPAIELAPHGVQHDTGK